MKKAIEIRNMHTAGHELYILHENVTLDEALSMLEQTQMVANEYDLISLDNDFNQIFSDVQEVNYHFRADYRHKLALPIYTLYDDDKVLVCNDHVLDIW